MDLPFDLYNNLVKIIKLQNTFLIREICNFKKINVEEVFEYLNTMEKSNVENVKVLKPFKFNKKKVFYDKFNNVYDENNEYLGRKVDSQVISYYREIYEK